MRIKMKKDRWIRPDQNNDQCYILQIETNIFSDELFCDHGASSKYNYAMYKSTKYILITPKALQIQPNNNNQMKLSEGI